MSQFSFDAPAVLGSALSVHNNGSGHASSIEQLSAVLRDEIASCPAERIPETIEVTFEVLPTQRSIDSKATFFRFWLYFGTHRYIFSGSFVQHIPPFSATATLAYSSLSQLVGWKSFAGVVGPTSFRLNLLDGVTITGNLTKGLGRRVFGVRGSGVWTSKCIAC